MAKLASSPAWQQLGKDAQAALMAQFNIQPPAAAAVTTEDDVVNAVKAASLANRRTLIEAVPQRFGMALDEAARQLDPKAVRVTLPSATIKNEKELDAWVDEARTAIKAKLKDGPVIV
jgi:hypothetical protein